MLSTLKDINKEEDDIISKLEFMENELDRYIHYSDDIYANTDDEVYTKVDQITSIVEHVEKNLEDLNQRFIRVTQRTNNYTSIAYENKSGEKLNVDVNIYNLRHMISQSC